MTPSRAARAVALGIVLTSATASTPSLAQQAPRPAHPARRSCVEFVQEAAADGRSLTFTLTNRCPDPVESAVGWSIVCGSAGDGTPVDRHDALGPGERRVVVAAADACGATAWRIEGVHWSWSHVGAAEGSAGRAAPHRPPGRGAVASRTAPRPPRPPR